MTTHHWDRSWPTTLSPALLQSGDMAIFSPIERTEEGREGREVTLRLHSEYRYVLGRQLIEEGIDHKGTVLFIMLNPSTADAAKSDPTVSRCINCARSWGYGHLLVCNIFALRSTDPNALYHHRDPVGPDNTAWIEQCAGEADKIVIAWGAHGNLKDQGDAVFSLLLRVPLWHKVYWLNRTKGGHPSHPLYLRADIVPELWWQS